MSSRPCAGQCGTQVTGRRKHCPDCRLKARARAERLRYHNDRGQDPDAYEYLDGDGEVVDYSQGAEQRPRFSPSSPRQNPRHDAVTRSRLDAQESATDEDPDMGTWDQVVNRPAETKVTFPPPGHSDPFGRRSSRYQGQAIDNPAAEGMAFTGSTTGGERALYDHLRKRR
jgi:hypothetical protein